MQLHLSDLEPGLIRQVEENVRARDALLPPGPAYRPPAPKPKLDFGRIFLAVFMTFAFWLAGLISVGVMAQKKVDDWYILFLFLASLLGSPALAAYWARNGWVLPALVQPANPIAAEAAAAAKRHEALISRPLTPDTLRFLFEVLQPRGEDAVYARSVLLLLTLVQENRMPEPQARDILAQLNGLMESDRELLNKLESIEQAIRAGEDVETLTAEQAQMETRLSATKDDAVRQATERSLAMLQTRIQNAQDLLTLNERIHAQRDAIGQTLASLESSLGRMHVSPDINDDQEMNTLQSTVTDLNRQSRSVEQAVAEVVRLSGSAG